MSLGRDDWVQALGLLDQALELPEAERAAWLDALPKELDHVRPMLATLLRQRASVEASGFLQSGAPAPDLAPDGFVAGQRIGPYRLLRQLGSGGMADVWLAERADGAHRRPVALKLPFSGAHGQRRMATGFVQECHVLSQLTHPNIASVLDAGTDGHGAHAVGRPRDDAGVRLAGAGLRQRHRYRQRCVFARRDAVRAAAGPTAA